MLFVAGNDVRGDDMLGPLLARRVEAMALGFVSVHSDFQFQVEHALDLPDDGLAIFVDAHCNQAEAVRFGEVGARQACAPGSHALSPEEVLGVAERIGRALPPAFVLSLRGRDFELGRPLSPSGQLVLGAGWGLLRALLARPSVASWRRLASTRSPAAAR